MSAVFSLFLKFSLPVEPLITTLKHFKFFKIQQVKGVFLRYQYEKFILPFVLKIRVNTV